QGKKVKLWRWRRRLRVLFGKPLIVGGTGPRPPARHFAPGDEPGVIACEEEHDPGDIVRLSDPPQCDVVVLNVTPLVIGVLICPGCTALTRMPCTPRSRAAALVSPRTPHLATT